ncbi:hypothetical protein [Oceanobacillus bengalensis]|nr:hypothetical protein [Oceanobacillus bengalensis]
MKKYMLMFGMILSVSLVAFSTQVVAEEVLENPIPQVKHNWVEYSTGFDEIEAGTHEYTYWKNFIKRTRTCLITHKIKTVVYYCDLHDHTKSETFLDEVIHSHQHSD